MKIECGVGDRYGNRHGTVFVAARGGRENRRLAHFGFDGFVVFVGRVLGRVGVAEGRAGHNQLGRAWVVGERGRGDGGRLQLVQVELALRQALDGAVRGQQSAPDVGLAHLLVDRPDEVGGRERWLRGWNRYVGGGELLLRRGRVDERRAAVRRRQLRRGGQLADRHPGGARAGGVVQPVRVQHVRASLDRIQGHIRKRMTQIHRVRLVVQVARVQPIQSNVVACVQLGKLVGRQLCNVAGAEALRDAEHRRQFGTAANQIVALLHPHVLAQCGRSKCDKIEFAIKNRLLRTCSPSPSSIERKCRTLTEQKTEQTKNRKCIIFAEYYRLRGNEMLPVFGLGPRLVCKRRLEPTLPSTLN